MLARVIADVPSHTRHCATVTSPFVCPAGTHNMLQSRELCELLADTLTSWSELGVVEYELHNVSNLSHLTSLTSLSLIDDEELGNLSELHALCHLHTFQLIGCADFSSMVANFTNMQKLCLEGRASKVDLSCCTQLMQIEMKYIHIHLQQLALPCGNDVHLQNLFLKHDAWDLGSDGNHHFVLQHLASASQLTSLSLCNVYPSKFRYRGWPSRMQELQELTATRMPGGPVQTWCHYPNLVSLDLSGLAQPNLPSGFSDMTQLKSLVLSAALLTVFPTCLLHLSHLSRLLLDNIWPPMLISKEIASIATWEYLRELDLSIPANHGDQLTYTLDTQVQLLKLHHILVPRGVTVTLSVLW